MNYKQAKNYLKKHNATIILAPVSRLSISFTGEPVTAMIQPDRIVRDTKRAAVELKKCLNVKNAPVPTTAHGAKTTTYRIPRRNKNVYTY